MARRQPPAPQPEAVILPPDLDDDEEGAGGGIPDEDGWVHLEGKDSEREDKKPKAPRVSRRNR